MIPCSVSRGGSGGAIPPVYWLAVVNGAVRLMEYRQVVNGAVNGGRLMESMGQLMGQAGLCGQ